MAGGSFPASVQTAGGMLKTFGQSVLTLASAEVPAANDAMGMFSYGVTAASAALNGIALGISTYNMLSSAASAVTGVWSSAVQVLNTMEAAHALRWWLLTAG